MKYSDLKPEKVFYYFQKISDIPRGSGNERAVAEFVCKTALELGYKAEIDAANNVFVKANATVGYENHTPIMLQGHLDMVCEANRNIKHDFLTDPIELVLDGDLLRANGTTLGADNGVAVATMLAILDSDTPHPALECLFTTCEETGLDGMRAFDATKANSRRLINLDSAGEGEATVSCAGGVRSHIHFDADLTPLNGEDVISIEIGGLFGGHSGEDINLGRIGAVSTMGRILYSISKNSHLRIVSIEGGSRDNAIPRECVATIAVDNKNALISALQVEEAKIRSELVADDAGFKVIISECTAETALTEERSKQMISLLRTLPNGVHGMSTQVNGLVETSSNLAVIRQNNNSWEIVVSSRSLVESKLDDMENRVECAAIAVDATFEHTSRYPGWDYLEGSPMQKLYLDTYKDLFGKEARVIGIHAGLECGLLKGKLPDMDMISIGPDIKNLHSPDEVLSVSSLARMWDLVCAMLKNA